MTACSVTATSAIDQMIRRKDFPFTGPCTNNPGFCSRIYGKDDPQRYQTKRSCWNRSHFVLIKLRHEAAHILTTSNIDTTILSFVLRGPTRKITANAEYGAIFQQFPIKSTTSSSRGQSVFVEHSWPISTCKPDNSGTHKGGRFTGFKECLTSAKRRAQHRGQVAYCR